MNPATTTDQFRNLLIRLVDEKQMSPGLMAIAYDYLFGHSQPVPFFVDTDLFNTVTYLKDIMAGDALQTPEELFAYFERKRQSLAAFIDGLKLEDDNTFFSPPTLKIQWEKAAFTPIDDGNDGGDALAYCCGTGRPQNLLPAPFRGTCLSLLPTSIKDITLSTYN